MGVRSEEVGGNGEASREEVEHGDADRDTRAKVKKVASKLERNFTIFRMRGNEGEKEKTGPYQRRREEERRGEIILITISSGPRG